MRKNCIHRKTKPLTVDGAYGTIQGPIDIIEDEHCDIILNASNSSCENCEHFEEKKLRE